MSWHEERPDGLLLRVLVQPRAARSEVAGIHDGRLKLRLAAPPVDGEANAELVRFLARRLGVQRSGVEIVSGGMGRRKTVRVAGATAAMVERLLAPGG